MWSKIVDIKILGNLNLIEIIGYIASVIVAVSLMMNSIVRLRWYNLIGASVFSVYGFIIKAYPVGFLNAFIALADIYYLFSIYKKKEYFTVQQVSFASEYLHYFLNYYRDDIKKYFPQFNPVKESGFIYFYLLRNISVAGIIAGKKDKSGYFVIYMDYAASEYRDMKLGKYFFGNTQEYFLNEGIKGYEAHCYNNGHEAYLLKLGFKQTGESKGYKIFRRQLA